MLDQKKHRTVLVEILQDIYADPQLRTILGFKGGTAAMLFYDLPRLSVDLDFDLLDADKKDLVFEKMKTLLPKHGTLLGATEKRYTLFFLIRYEKGEHSIKIDISKRAGISGFHRKNYLGVTVLVMKEVDMIACKLSALLTRKKFAMRDVFDVWFFFKNHWMVNEVVLKERAEVSVKKALAQAIRKVRPIEKNEVLEGLGELLSEKQRIWAKDKLIDETIFQLKLYEKHMAE